MITQAQYLWTSAGQHLAQSWMSNSGMRPGRLWRSYTELAGLTKYKSTKKWPSSHSLYKPSWYRLTPPSRGWKAPGNCRVRAIGVSNFTVTHLEKLLEVAIVCPAVNQVTSELYVMRIITGFGLLYSIFQLTVQDSLSQAYIRTLYNWLEADFVVQTILLSA